MINPALIVLSGGGPCIGPSHFRSGYIVYLHPGVDIRDRSTIRCDLFPPGEGIISPKDSRKGLKMMTPARITSLVLLLAGLASQGQVSLYLSI